MPKGKLVYVISNSFQRQHLIRFFKLVNNLPPIRALYATPTLQILLFAAAAKNKILILNSFFLLFNLPTSPAHLVPCLCN